MISKSKVKLGIVGIGAMGTAHARSVVHGKVPGLELAAICDFNTARFDEFPGVARHKDYRDLLANDDIDAVLVATPHYDHVPVGIASLQAGKHTLVEKPIAVHKADAQKLAAAHTDKSLVFAAMFNQRTDPKYRWLKDEISRGGLGKITRITWIMTNWFRTETYYRNGSWRATWSGEGGGVLLNQCPHQLDLWQWLFGMPDRVTSISRLGHYHNIEVEDDVTAILDYKDGPIGTFITTTGEAPGTNRLEVAADRARVIVEGNRIEIVRNAISTSEFCAAASESFATPPREYEGVLTFNDSGEQHIGILKNFVAAIRGEAELIAPAEEGQHSVELGNAILFAGLNEQAVALPIDAEKYAEKLDALIRESDFVKPKPDQGDTVSDLTNSFA